MMALLLFTVNVARIEARTCSREEVARIEGMRWTFDLSDCTSLSLGHANLNDEGMSALAVALNGNKLVKFLDIQGNAIGDVGMMSLADTLLENKAITKIDLRRNMLGDTGANALRLSFQVNTALTAVDMRQNQIGIETQSLLGATASSLLQDFNQVPVKHLRENDSSLTTLNFARLPIGVAGATALASAIANNTVVTTLELGDASQIGVTGANQLAKALQTNKGITSLHFRGSMRAGQALQQFALCNAATATHRERQACKTEALASMDAKDEL